MHNADQTDPVGRLLDAAILAGEDRGQIDPSTLEANSAALSDSHGLIVEWVVQLAEPSIRAPRQLLELTRILHVQCFVRAFNLRDFEGRSALLLGKAKDNNACCAIGPFIGLFDERLDIDDVRQAELAMRVDHADKIATWTLGVGVLMKSLAARR